MVGASPDISAAAAFDLTIFVTTNDHSGIFVIESGQPLSRRARSRSTLERTYSSLIGVSHSTSIAITGGPTARTNVGVSTQRPPTLLGESKSIAGSTDHYRYVKWNVLGRCRQPQLSGATTALKDFVTLDGHLARMGHAISFQGANGLTFRPVGDIMKFFIPLVMWIVFFELKVSSTRKYGKYMRVCWQCRDVLYLHQMIRAQC